MSISGGGIGPALNQYARSFSSSTSSALTHWHLLNDSHIAALKLPRSS